MPGEKGDRMNDQCFILTVALGLLVDWLLRHSAATARRRERQHMIDRLIDFTPRPAQLHEDWQERARRERC
jgi:hypothetical protein